MMSIYPKSRALYNLYVTINIILYTHTHIYTRDRYNEHFTSRVLLYFWLMIIFVLCYNIKSKIRISLQSNNGTTDYNM